MPLAKSIVTLQIITLALLFGVINIAVILVAVTMFSGDVKLSSELDVLTIVAMAFAIMVTIAAAIVPGIVRRQGAPFAAEAARQRDDANSPVVDPSKPMSPPEKQMFAVYQTSHIIKAALLEGGAVMASIIFVTNTSIICIAIAVVLMVLLASIFPTTGRVVAWMEESIRSGSLDAFRNDAR